MLSIAIASVDSREQTEADRAGGAGRTHRSRRSRSGEALHGCLYVNNTLALFWTHWSVHSKRNETNWEVAALRWPLDYRLVDEVQLD